MQQQQQMGVKSNGAIEVNCIRRFRHLVNLFLVSELVYTYVNVCAYIFVRFCWCFASCPVSLSLFILTIIVVVIVPQQLWVVQIRSRDAIYGNRNLSINPRLLVCIRKNEHERLCVYLFALTLLPKWKCISWAWPTLGCKRMSPWVHLVCTNRVGTHLFMDSFVHTSLPCVVQAQTVALMISFCVFALHFKCINLIYPQPTDTFNLR